MKLKIAYFGTPDFSARFLEKIILDKDLPVEVVLVVTQPDKPIGRKKIMTSSPVKHIANKYKIEVADMSQQNFRDSQLFEQATRRSLQVAKTATASDPEGAAEEMRVDLARKFSVANINIALLYAYGEIIPPDVLKIPRFGFWNIHPSLLPRFRGPAPMAYPLLLGEKETGVTLMKMDEEVDHGPIIAQEKYAIKPNDKRSDLEKNLTDLGFELFHSVILRSKATKDPGQKAASLDSSATPQNDNDATHTRQLTKQDGFIPLSMLQKALNGESLNETDELPKIISQYLEKHPNEKNNFYKKTLNFSLLTFNLFRGCGTWPGLWTKVMINGVEKRLKLTEMSVVTGQLSVVKVQLEGKTEVLFTEFNRVYDLHRPG